MTSAVRQANRRPRKAPPVRSYIPFGVLVLCCLLILVGLIYLITRLFGGSSGVAQSPTLTPTDTAVLILSPSATPLPTDTLQPGQPTYTPVPPTFTPVPGVPTATIAGGLALTPGGPLPTTTPAPTATASGKATMVVARGVDDAGRPVQQAKRFISPATRLYAVVLVRQVHSSDVLRFVFQRNEVTLPRDDITYSAGIDAPSHVFHAYADYGDGSQPLPHGSYRVLFYRNGRLEAVTAFRVG